MAEFILKDSKGNDKTFNHDKIFVQDVDGNLVQFTEGDGDIPAVLQDKTITENGTYTADDGYDGLGSVLVNIAMTGALPVIACGETPTANYGTSITVTHGLGVIPDIIIVYPGYIADTSNMGSGTYYFVAVSQAFKNKVGNSSLELLNALQTINSTIYFRETSSKDFTGTYSNGIQSANEQSFVIPSCVFSNCRYMWIAIGGLTE